jgi:O-antigen ligase
MPNSPQFSDYEPVTHPKGGRDRKLHDEVWSDFPSHDTDSDCELKSSVAVSADVGLLQDATKKRLEPAIELAAGPPKENWLAKRGHSVTFAGLLIFTFLVFFRPYEWSPSLAWLSSSAFFVAIFTLVVFVPVQLGLEGTLTSRPKEVNLVLVLLLACALSIPLATDRLRAWNAFVEYLKVVLMFIVMVNVIRSEKRLKAIIWVVLIASCVLSISALNDFEAGNLALRGQRIEGAIGGLFQNPNDLALHLVTIIPITFALLIASRLIIMKALYGLCLLLFVVGIVMTFSRGGFLGLIAATAIFVWRLPRRNKLLMPIILCPLLLAIVVLAPAGYGSRLSTTNDESAAARTDELKRSLYIAARHPLLGVGMDNYVLYSNFDHATHNAYTQVASEAGLAAAVVYVLLLITPIKQLRRIAQETGSERLRSRFYYFAIGLEASLVGYMVSSFFASVAYLWYAYYLMAYVICLRRLYVADKDKMAVATVGE